MTNTSNIKIVDFSFSWTVGVCYYKKQKQKNKLKNSSKEKKIPVQSQSNLLSENFMGRNSNLKTFENKTRSSTNALQSPGNCHERKKLLNGTNSQGKL